MDQRGVGCDSEEEGNRTEHKVKNQAKTVVARCVRKDFACCFLTTTKGAGLQCTKEPGLSKRPS